MIKEVIIKNSKFTKYISFFFEVRGITIFPFIVLSDNGDRFVINHERIHIEQQKELWVIPFYLIYILFWIYGLIKNCMHKEMFILAYLQIPFEREAYANDYNLNYLETRSKFSWLKYVKF